MEGLLKVHFSPDPPSTSRIPIYWLTQILLAIGILASVVGYLGCFTVVQSVQNNAAPVIWLGLEAALSIIRMFIWAANPKWDSAPPLLFTLKLAPFLPSYMQQVWRNHQN